MNAENPTHIIAIGEAIGFLPALDKSGKRITVIGTASTASESETYLSEAIGRGPSPSSTGSEARERDIPSASETSDGWRFG